MVTKTAVRRSKEELGAAAKKVDELISGGMAMTGACMEVGISPATYKNNSESGGGGYDHAQIIARAITSARKSVAVLRGYGMDAELVIQVKK